MRISAVLSLALLCAAAAGAEAPAASAQGPLSAALTEFNRGGSLMWVILAVSVFGLAFGLERLFALRHGRHLPAGLLERTEALARASGWAAAREPLRGDASALGRLLDAVLARDGASRAELDRVLEDEGARILWDLRANLRPLSLVVGVSPLLGLLGTVLGLILAFRQAATLGMEDPRTFAEGINLALYTTAMGLAVAIPFLMFHHYLRGKADVLLREAEEQAIRFLAGNCK